MPRTIWSGAISFGLVTVPCHVRKVCAIDDREVSSAEIGKGYEYAKDQLATITDDDLSNLPLPTAKAIEIEAFVPLASVDLIRIGEGY